MRRLKGKLGAESGATGYLSFLIGDGGIDGDYVRDLEAKLQCVTRARPSGSQLIVP